MAGSNARIVHTLATTLLLACTLVAGTAKAALDPPDLVETFSIECGGIAPRGVEAQIYLADSAPIGTIAFHTGGHGKAAYTIRPERAKTVHFMREAGFDVYVLLFTDEDGWQTGAQGFGSRGGTCVYAEAVLWVASHAANPDALCIQGNSAGSKLIAYGIQEHGLDGVVDLAIPTAGPSGSTPIEICEGDVGNPSEDTKREIDLSMGWPVGTCTGDSPLTPEQRDELLIDGLAYRENLRHRTRISMMMGSDDKAKGSALAWMDTMRSPPTRVDLLLVDGIDHKFDKHPEGAALVREKLLTQCRSF
jgi:hypothetical protein